MAEEELKMKRNVYDDRKWSLTEALLDHILSPHRVNSTLLKVLALASVAFPSSLSSSPPSPSLVINITIIST